MRNHPFRVLHAVTATTKARALATGAATVTATMALLAGAAPTWASAIKNTTGAVTEVTHDWVVFNGASLAEGMIEDNLAIRVFQETLNQCLAAPLNVDITVPGVYGLPLTPGVVPASECITSFYFHVDPVGGVPTGYTGTITFSQDILGIIVDDANLDTSDLSLGATDLVYPTGDFFRGVEVSGTDQIQLVNYRRIALNLQTDFHVDGMRVILEADGPGVTFSIDYQGPTDVMAESFGGGGIIGSGNILTVGDGGAPGPNPPIPAPALLPGMMIDALSLGILNPGAGGIAELDAMSYGDDAGSRLEFSVDEFAQGDPAAGPAPDVFSEAAAPRDEASADLFRYLGPLTLTAPGLVFGNRAAQDGNGLTPFGAPGRPGFGLAEPNPEAFGLPDAGDNLDGIDLGTTPADLGTVFFSLDGNFVDSREAGGLPPNTGTAIANGFSGADILVVAPGVGAVAAVYVPAAALGLQAGDDIDAILVNNDNADDLAGDNGVNYDAWDTVLFSLRRGSPSIGMIPAGGGLPITEADILAPGPTIVIPGEALGLIVDRVAPPDTLTDDLDAMDAFFPRQFPDAQDDDDNGLGGGQIMLDILANDLALYGALDPSTVRIFRQPEHGWIVGIDPGTGMVTYQHDGLGSTTDMFQYVVSDTSAMVSDVTTVTLDISGPAGIDPMPDAVQFFRAGGSNPSGGDTALSFAVEQDGPVQIDIFDVAGRHVRRVFDQSVRAGETYQVAWDGKNGQGRAVSGICYARLSTETGERKVGIVRLR